MPEVDLTNLSVSELHELEKDVSRRINHRKEEDRKRVFRQMKDLAAGIGMTIDEVTDRDKRPNAKRGHVKPKYKNPDNPSETWSGRGKKPAWVQQALQRGQTLEDLAIQVSIPT